MTTWLLHLFDRLRNSLWFVPSLGLLLALGLAIGMLKLDNIVRIETVPQLEWATTTGPSARATLSALAGALVTVTGVVFSVTMLTLAQTSSMFGSRLLRSFLNHNLPQATLALFLGTSTYCFVVLRSIQELDGGSLFSPHLSVTVGLIGGLACLATFVSFIHHVSTSIQAQTVVRNVAYDLEDAIDRLFPEEIGSRTSSDMERMGNSHSWPSDEETSQIESNHDGYIQAIDGRALLELMVAYDTKIRLKRRPGDFISRGTLLGVIGHPPDKRLGRAVNECFLVGMRRTPRQDVECAIQELVEVAVRALSPGINDPHTAAACIDYLGAALVRLAGREIPSAVRHDKDQNVRVIAVPYRFSDLLNTALDEIRQYGRESFQVTLHMLDTLAAIARKVQRDADRAAILRQAAMIERGAEAGLPEKYDRADVQEKLRTVRQLLESDSSAG